MQSTNKGIGVCSVERVDWRTMRLILVITVLNLGLCLTQSQLIAGEYDRDITFIVLADPQLSACEPIQGSPDLETLVSNINNISGKTWPSGGKVNTPNGIVIVGDLTQDVGVYKTIFSGLQTCDDYAVAWTGTHPTFSRFQQYFENGHSTGKAVKFPVYVGLGNHDFTAYVWPIDNPDECNTARQSMWRYIRDRHLGQDAPVAVTRMDSRVVSGDETQSGAYSWDWGIFHCVQLHRYGGDTGDSDNWEGKNGWTWKSSLSWLKTDLESAASRFAEIRRPIILFQHYGWGPATGPAGFDSRFQCPDHPYAKTYNAPGTCATCGKQLIRSYYCEDHYPQIFGQHYTNNCMFPTNKTTNPVTRCNKTLELGYHCPSHPNRQPALSGGPCPKCSDPLQQIKYCKDHWYNTFYKSIQCPIGNCPRKYVQHIFVWFRDERDALNKVLDGYNVVGIFHGHDHINTTIIDRSPELQNGTIDIYNAPRAYGADHAFTLAHLTDQNLRVGNVDNAGTVEDVPNTGTMSLYNPGPPCLEEFGGNGDWNENEYPRLMGDVNGDGLADIIAFGAGGVRVALATENLASPFRLLWAILTEFQGDGGWNENIYPRLVGDVNGDGLADIVGFGSDKTQVALATGNPEMPFMRVGDLSAFYEESGWRVNKHPRFLADVNGDGKADIVGFGDPGTYVALATGNAASPFDWPFNKQNPPVPALRQFGYNYEVGEWRVEKHPRLLADVNGDGRADIVGFADAGIYVSLATGDVVKPFIDPPVLALREFGYSAGGWRVEQHLRLLADVNGDGRADIVGFSNDGTYVSLAQKEHEKTAEFPIFKPSVKALDFYMYGNGQGWLNDKHPRMLADVNGDGRADIVGFGSECVYVALAKEYDDPVKPFYKRVPLIYAYGYDSEGWRVGKHPRMMADIDGDKAAEIVAFGDFGVHVTQPEEHGIFINHPPAFTANPIELPAYEGFAFQEDLKKFVTDPDTNEFFTFQKLSGNDWLVVSADGKLSGTPGIANIGLQEFDIEVQDKYEAAAGTKLRITVTTKVLDYQNLAPPVLENFSSNTGWDLERYPRLMGDVNGDGREDIVGFWNDGTYVSLAEDSGFSGPVKATSGFRYLDGTRWLVGKHPRLLADINGDGRTDIVGFYDDGTYVAIAKKNQVPTDEYPVFHPVLKAFDHFGFNSGWDPATLRLLGDVNGDGLADIVGFNYAGTVVALATGDAAKPFSDPVSPFEYFRYSDIVIDGTTLPGWRVEKHPRLLADVNGDGRADIVGFHDDGVWVALATGDSALFEDARLVLGQFGYNAGGWRVEYHVRLLGDVNGDGMADIVGFANDGTYVALANRTNSIFTPPNVKVLEAFHYDNGTRWLVDKHPRLLADVNGDGRLDIVGFYNYGTYMALAKSEEDSEKPFHSTFQLTPAYSYNLGWRVYKHLRMLADVDADGFQEIVGFGDAGVYVTQLEDCAIDYDQNGRADGWEIRYERCLSGDFNLDSFINLNDFSILALRWLENEDDSWTGSCDSDLSSDTYMDIEDLNIMIQHWLQSQ